MEESHSKVEKSARKRKAAASAVTYFFLALWAIIVLFPFY